MPGNIPGNIAQPPPPLGMPPNFPNFQNMSTNMPINLRNFLSMNNWNLLK